MKKIRGVLAVLAVFTGFTGCTEKAEELHVPDNYSSWRRVNDVELDYPIPGHESNYRIIYMNDIGFEAETVKAGGKEELHYPAGTIIAKAVYEGLNPEPGADPVMVTAMIKNPDHPNARGGWVWTVKNLGTGEEQIIEGQFCFTCHSAANESHPYADGNPREEFRDYVFFSAQ